MYAQCQDGVWRELVGNIHFSPNVFQTAESLSVEQRQEFGVFWVVDNQPTLPECHTWGDFVWKVDGSTVVRTWVPVPMNAEQLAAKAIADLEAAKAERHHLVDAITVTTASGKVFDGDKDAQISMANAIAGMDDGDELPWVLHDNTVAVVTRAELREALRLAGAETTAIWVAPYIAA